MSSKRCFGFMRNQSHKRCIIFLSLFWAAGSLLGACLSASVSTHITLDLRRLLYVQPSLIRMVFVSLFPLLLTVFCLHFSLSLPIYLIAFVKSALYSFSLCYLLLSYRSSGWLLHALFLFSQSVTAVLLIWFWICSIDNCSVVRRETAISVSVITAVCMMNCCIVSPFLSSLFNQ